MMIFTSLFKKARQCLGRHECRQTMTGQKLQAALLAIPAFLRRIDKTCQEYYTYTGRQQIISARAFQELYQFLGSDYL